MYRRFSSSLRPFAGAEQEVFLSLIWCVGIGCGVYFATRADEIYLSLMRKAAYCPVSIVGLAASAYLPYLLSAFAVNFGNRWLLLGICFLKALMFAFAAGAVHLAFGSAGWLFRWLLLFSDSTSLWLLLWFALRHIKGQGISFRRDLVVCFGAVTAVCSIDYCVISPFLAMIAGQ